MARLTVLLALLALGSPNSAGAIGSQRAVPPPDVDELERLYEARDYFTLRERIGEPARDESREIRVLRAASAHAFNDLERSNRLLEPVLAEGASLRDSLRYEARLLRARNLFRLHRYGEAAGVYKKLISELPAFVDSATIADHRNMLMTTVVLEDVPPQRVTARSPTTLPAVEGTHVELTIGDSVRDYSIDTGADFSVLIRSEAEALGLEIREAGVRVGSSTDIEVAADLAVAERVRLGGIELENVAFIVVPDRMLTFPQAVIRGLIGFPVLEALGEVTFRSDGGIEVPGRVPKRDVHNLALHDLKMYTRVGYREDELLCTIDTGSMRTWFYEPFYRRYRSRIEETGRPDTVSTSGLGGAQDLPAYRMEDLRLQIGGREARLPEAAVYTRPVGNRSTALDCNVGRDLLSSHGAYTFNFRSMSVLLH